MLKIKKNIERVEERFMLEEFGRDIYEKYTNKYNAELRAIELRFSKLGKSNS
jgi:hypothetical protein